MTDRKIPSCDSDSLELADTDLVEVHGGLKYKLDRAFIKSWSTSGDANDRPTEEVAFALPTPPSL